MAGRFMNNYIYYFVADRGQFDVVRVLRVCDCARLACTSEFQALYELTMECSSSATENTRVCGVDLVESFAGQPGPLVVVTRCEAGGTGSRNRACAIRLADVDSSMDTFFTGCKTGVHSQSQLPWETPRPCSQFSVSQGLSTCVGTIDNMRMHSTTSPVRNSTCA